MGSRKSRGCLKPIALGILLFTAGSFPLAGRADVTASGLGTAVDNSIAGTYNITGGTRPSNGPNLFHSFGNFSLGAPEIASFLNDSGLATSNILARVTNGNPSNIFGTIDTSAFGAANLFLMNPAGILFGPTAQLNVGGAFHATTADYINLGGDGVFHANPAQVSVLTSSPPSAFGFLSASPAAIDVNTSSLLVGAPGQPLSFVGGPVNVGAADGSAPAYVLALVGRVNLVSVASSGEAAFDGTGFSVDGFPQLGPINVRGGSIVDGKEIFVRGGQLAVNDALLSPGVFTLFGLPAPLPDGGEVNIKVSGNVTMTGMPGNPALFGFDSGVFVYGGGDGVTISPGDVPGITIEAQNVSLSGATGLESNRVGPGQSGAITISAKTLTLQNGANIASLNSFQGAGGDIVINAEQVVLSGNGTPNAVGFEGIAAQGIFHPEYFVSSIDPALTNAGSGNITINASKSLSVTGTAQITTDSLAFGNGGDIKINTGDMFLSSVGAEAAAIAAQSALAGDAGNITITATGSITLSDGFRISATTGGSGDGGDVQITAGGGVTLNGANSRILSGTVQQPDDVLNDTFLSVYGISFDDLRTAVMGDPSASLMDVLTFLNNIGFTAIPDLIPGDAGTITVNTPVLTMNADTRIEASTGWEGTAGSIVANVGSLSLNDGASIRNRSGIQLLTGDYVIGPGDAGSVNITASDAIWISGRSPTTGDGSAITTTTLGDGNGGDIVLSAGNSVTISNGGSVSSDSLALAGAGTGLTGNVTITTGDSITLDGGTISTRAVTSDGGNINLFAPNIVYLNNSQITTSVESGVGGGGNIFIDPQFVILNNSFIIANAFGGPGGNITIIADNFLSSTTSVIEASSALSTPGVIQIQSPDNNVESSIQVLSAAFLDASSQLRGLCSARRTGAPSSFTVASRGGVPVEADGYLPSFGADAATASASAAGPARATAGSIGGQPIALALVMPDSLNCMR